jgi:hypothetical protein
LDTCDEFQFSGGCRIFWQGQNRAGHLLAINEAPGVGIVKAGKSEEDFHLGIMLKISSLDNGSRLMKIETYVILLIN